MAHDHEEIRATIVEAARDIFSRYGYKKTTLDDIASSLHRVKSSLYYYFKNKEDLFRAVIEYEASRAIKASHDAVDQETTPEAKMRTYFNTMLLFINETRSYYKLLMQEEIFEVLSFAEEAKKKHEKESTQFLASILQEGIKDGTFTIHGIEGAVGALKFMFDGLMNACVDGSLTEKKLDALLNILFNGIKTK